MRNIAKPAVLAILILFCISLAAEPVIAVKDNGALGGLDTDGSHSSAAPAVEKADGMGLGAGAGAPAASGFKNFSGYCTASPYLNVRTGAWGSVVGSLKPGAKVTVTGKAGEWYKISQSGKTRYVFAKYISKNAPGGSAGSNASAGGTSFTGYVTTGTLNVRTAPWGSKTGTLSRGASVKVTGKSGDWYKIDSGGKTRFVHSDYISKNKPSSGGSSSGGGSHSGGKGWGGRPVAGGRISSSYGWRNCPFHGREFHKGVDLAVGGGTPVKSPGPGKVIYRGWCGGYGNFIKVQHDNGYVTCYAHLKSYNVSNGQRVGQGTVLGAVNSTGSSTGNHLHFEILKGGQAVNPASVSGLGI